MTRIRSKTLCLGLLVCFILGCSHPRKEQWQDQKAADQLEMYVFDMGTILVRQPELLNGGSSIKNPHHFTNTAFLIRHPKGDLIWDTGYNDSIVYQPLGDATTAFYSSMTRGLEDQLEELGLSPRDIEYAALSHQHPDHSGNLGLFTGATLLLQAEEYDTLFHSSNSSFGHLKNNSKRRLGGNYDVFGDSSVVIIRTPGHTSGHQVLLVQLPETGPVVLSGDLWLFNLANKEQGVPLFNVDVDETERSRQKVLSLLEKEGAVLWVQHDSLQMSGIPHFPEVVR